MNNGLLTKKANALFASVVTIAVCANLFVSLLSVKGIKINILANLLISQMIIAVPALIYYVCINKAEERIIMYKKIKVSTVFLLVVFTWLIMPVVSAVNVLSQLFTKNEVLSISDGVLELPVILMVFIMGIVGPFCEEFAFRGLIFNCLKKGSGRYIASGIVSALFFGLMHMNFNQFCYAFVLGIVFALVNEVLDSTWPSFICHAVVNIQNVLMLYMANAVFKMAGGNGISDYYSNAYGNLEGNGYTMKIMLLMMAAMMLAISLVTIFLAALLFYGICKIEGKQDRLKELFSKNKEKINSKVLSAAGYFGIVLCVFVMFFLEPIINLLGK